MGEGEVRYRWLDTEKPVVCRAREAHACRGLVERIVTLPVPGCVGNVLLDFGGRLVLLAAGTLRRAS